MMPGRFYRADLAAIHDQGFTSFARGAAPGLLKLLAGLKPRNKLVVDLGCGSGVWASLLKRAGYEVVGIDISSAMLKLARRRAPGAAFRRQSLWNTRLPSCGAVTSLGECFSYCCDAAPSARRLSRLFARIYQALEPGGALIFDVVTRGRVANQPQKTWFQGDDWFVLVESREHAARRLLTRSITTLRKNGTTWRAAHELHRQRLFDAARILALLRQAGFRPRQLAGYGRMRFVRGQAGFLAIKPA